MGSTSLSKSTAKLKAKSASSSIKPHLLKSSRYEFLGANKNKNIYSRSDNYLLLYNNVIRKYKFTYDISPVFNWANAVPVALVNLGFMHSVAVLLNIVKLRCEEFVELHSWGFDPNFSDKLTSKNHGRRKLAQVIIEGRNETN